MNHFTNPTCSGSTLTDSSPLPLPPLVHGRCSPSCESEDCLLRHANAWQGPRRSVCHSASHRQACPSASRELGFVGASWPISSQLKRGMGAEGNTSKLSSALCDWESGRERKPWAPRVLHTIRGRKWTKNIGACLCTMHSRAICFQGKASRGWVDTDPITGLCSGSIYSGSAQTAVERVSEACFSDATYTSLLSPREHQSRLGKWEFGPDRTL